MAFCNKCETEIEKSVENRLQFSNSIKEMSVVFMLSFFLVFIFMVNPAKSNDQAIDVFIKGVDDGKKTTRSQDYNEAVMAAKLEAIERAGVEIKSVLEMENFKLKYHHMESKAKAVILPGFKVMDMGYQTDGTYQVVLSAKILRSQNPEKNGAVNDFSDCTKLEERLLRQLDDLTSPKKIRTVIKDLTQIPFDLNCGKIHFSAVNKLIGRGVYNPDYRDFLINTAYQIHQPEKDRRAETILRYLVSDRKLDDTEWKVMLEFLRNGQGRNFYAILYYLLNGDRLKTEQSYQTAKDRIHTYFALAEKGEIGKSDFHGIKASFYPMVRAVQNSRADVTRKHHLTYYIYETYYPKLTDKAGTTDYAYLKKIYHNEDIDLSKEKLFKWICEGFIYTPTDKKNSSRKASYDMWDFIKELKKKSEDDSLSQESKERYQRHLKAFFDKCMTRFTEGLYVFKNSSVMDAITIFFIENNISAPGHVPSLKELGNRLTVKDYRTRSNAAKLLLKLGKRPIAIEGQLIALVSKPKRLKEHERYIHTIRDTLEIIGNTKTSNKKAHNILVKYLKTEKYRASDAAGKAIISIGQPMIPLLLQDINSLSIYAQRDVVRIIEKMGLLTPESETFLTNSVKSIKNKQIKESISALLDDF